MAKLTASGIVFGDSTILNSKYGIVPQNSVSIFYQASAPTGWTKDTTHNDKTLRVVNGTGGGSGGTSPFTTVFPNALRTFSSPNIPVTGTVGNTTLSTPQLPSHTHPNGGSVGLTPGGGDVAFGAGWTRTSPSTGSGPTVGGGAHAHPWSGTAQWALDVDLRITYIDVILCSFA
jgi:hypothetical protein